MVSSMFILKDQLLKLNRVVHAKASGAWGEFEVTNDISSLTSAKFLNGIGKKTKVLFRLSTTGGEKGSADTVRDVRGFSVKFYTEDGNHDIVGNHIVSLTSLGQSSDPKITFHLTARVLRARSNPFPIPEPKPQKTPYHKSA